MTTRKSPYEISYNLILNWNGTLKIGRDGAPSKKELTLLINKVSEALAQKDAEIEVLREACVFYAQEGNWEEVYETFGGDGQNDGDVGRLVDMEDVELKSDNDGIYFACAGMRARQAIAKADAIRSGEEQNPWTSLSKTELKELSTIFKMAHEIAKQTEDEE